MTLMHIGQRHVQQAGDFSGSLRRNPAAHALRGVQGGQQAGTSERAIGGERSAQGRQIDFRHNRSRLRTV